MPRNIKILRNGHPIYTSNIMSSDVILSDAEYDKIVEQKQLEHDLKQKQIEEEISEQSAINKLIQSKLRKLTVGIIASESLARIT